MVFYIDYQITLKKKWENIIKWNNRTKENDFFFNNNFLKYIIIRKAIYRMTLSSERNLSRNNRKWSEYDNWFNILEK